MKYLILATIVLSCLITQLNGAKILGIFPFPGPSQYILAQPYFRALASRGHEVTVISAFPQKVPLQNFRDISVAEVLKLNEELVKEYAAVTNRWEEFFFLSTYAKYTTLNVLNNREVQQLMQSKERFDLVIMETLHNEPLLGLAEHFGAHLIGISTFGTAPYIDDLVGNTSPISYIPHVFLGLTDRMNYWQRLQNVALTSLEFIHHQLRHLPMQEVIYRQYFPHAKQSMLDVRKNVTLMLLNQHFSLSFPRPYVPNMIEVGGMHISRKVGTLPEDMQRFINGSGSAGVIYFSMGSNVKSKDLPQETLQIILNTFASLKQRVMWKFEDTELPGKPANVFISQWFPQPDILAHPSVKLFITHGGLLSTIESIYYGKPVVGMPVFFDQFLNVKRAEMAGYGLGVDLTHLTESDFKSKINKVLSEPKYTEMVKKMSQRYRDQPMLPLDSAIYWTEYILRHDGANHMRSAAQDLNFWQYNSIDTFGLLFGGIGGALLIIVWLVIKLAKFVVHKLCSSKSKVKQS